MGAEYSQQGRRGGKKRRVLEDHDERKYPRDRRCYKCSGHGRLFVEYECYSCRNQSDPTWSNYSRQCSCNGYGRVTSYETCDDCWGRGWK